MNRTLVCLLSLAVAAPALADPSAKEILQKARDQGALNLVGLKADLKMVNVEADGTQKVRELSTQSRKLDGVTKTISRFKSPPDVAGVALLVVEGQGGAADEISLYAPKVRRTRKIAAGSRSESFMESELSYADFSGGSLDQGEPKLEADARFDGKDCYVVSGTPKDSPYKKVTATIEKASFRPLEVRYFDEQGLLKVYTVKKVEPRAGHDIATESVMENARTHRKSTLSVGNVIPADAPDAAFTDRGLERGVIVSLLAVALLAASPEDAGSLEDAGAVEADAGPSTPLGMNGDMDDAGPSTPLGESGDAGNPFTPSAVEAPPPPPPFFDFSVPTSLRVFGQVRSKLAIDANFESRPGEPLAENVTELQTHANLGASADFGEHARAVAEVRLWHRAVEQRSPPGDRFLIFNGEHGKGTLELQAGESYLDLYTKWVDLRFGNQVLAFGANASGAPADLLNPFDLREGIFFVDDPADVKRPVLAARARGEVQGFGWMVAYVPFFVPDRYDLYGQDEALIQPGLGQAVPAFPLLTLAQQDRAEQPIIETDRPQDLPQNGDLGVRVTRKLGPVTVGADYIISREKIPEVIIDSELARFLNEGPGANFSDPATSLSLSQRIGAGEQLVHGSFPRFAVGEAEASALIGPAQLDVDLGHSASRLYVDSHLNPVFHATTTAVIGISDARGTDLTLAANFVGLWIHDIPGGEALELLDPPSASASAHQTLGGFGALLVGYRWLQDRIEGEGRFLLDPRQGSYAIGGRASWNLSGHVHFVCGYQRFSGVAQSPFGYFRRNDAVWGEIRLDL